MPKISTPDLDDPAAAEQAAEAAEHEHHDTERRFAAGQLDDPAAVEQAAEKAGRLRRLAEMVTTRAAHRAERDRQAAGTADVDQLHKQLRDLDDTDADLAQKLDDVRTAVAAYWSAAEQRQHQFADAATLARRLDGRRGDIHAVNDLTFAARISDPTPDGVQGIEVAGAKAEPIRPDLMMLAVVPGGALRQLGDRSRDQFPRFKDLADAASRAATRFTDTHGGAA